MRRRHEEVVRQTVRAADPQRGRSVPTLKATPADIRCQAQTSTQQQQSFTDTVDPRWWETGVWQGQPIGVFLANRDLSAVFSFLHTRGISYFRIAAVTTLTASRVSDITRGKRLVQSQDLIARIAQGLDIPRHLMGLDPSVTRVPNDQLRQARLRQPSPSGSGRRMSRRELADQVNAYLARNGRTQCSMDDTHIGKLERGQHRWPQQHYRDALRAVLGAKADAQLGFWVNRTQTDLL